MTDQPWGVGEDSPMNEGSEATAVPGGSWGEQRAGEATADDPTGGGSRDDALAWGEDADERGAAEQGGQPNLSPDPPVAGRPSRLSPGATDDAPGTPPGRSLG